MKYLVSSCAVMLASVLSAAPEEVRLSSFDPEKDDATAAFEAAFASGAKKIIVDDPGFDYIVRPLFVPSDAEVVFMDKVSVRAKKEEFKGTNDSLFKILNQKNVILRGEGTVLLEMNKSDYQDKTRYKRAEWRHGVAIIGSENVIVRDLTIRSSGGDGIYVSNSKTDCARNVLIENVTCENHHRQGISVISAENLIVRNSRFNDTSGTAPACGIDFEPNEAKERLVNILVENCEFSRNDWGGILFQLMPLKETSAPVSITVRDCRMEGNRSGLLAYIGSVKGEILLDNCTFSGNGESAVLRHLFGNLKFVVKKSRFQDKKCEIAIIGERAFDSGNLFLDGVEMVTDSAEPVKLECIEGFGIVNSRFDLTFGEASVQKPFDSEAFLKAHAPNPAQRKSVREVDPKMLKAGTGNCKDGLGNMNIRGKFRFLQAVPDSGTYPIRFTFLKIGPRKLQGTITVWDQDGIIVDSLEVTPVDDQFVYKLKASKGAAVYMFEVNFGGHGVQLHADFPGQGILADRQLPLIWGDTKKMYFVVPAQAAEVNVEICGSDGDEWVIGTLRDAGQQVMAKTEKVYVVPKTLHAERTPTERNEIWELELQAAEDHHVRLLAPCLPIFYTAPENILIAK